MNSKLPIEGQKIQVKLKDGEWQEAIYREDVFVDMYGLPLPFDKITEWRAAGGQINGSAGRAPPSNTWHAAG